MSTEKEKERAAKRRAEFIAQGLNSKGKPRKGRHKPKPLKDFVTHRNSNIARKKEPAPRKRETPEQRRARGAALRTTPLASKIEESVNYRLMRAKRHDVPKPRQRGTR